MFQPKQKALTIDGVELVVRELTARQAKDIGAMEDGWAATRKAFVTMIRKPDGSPLFASEEEVDDLPTGVVKQFSEVVAELNDPKQ